MAEHDLPLNTEDAAPAVKSPWQQLDFEKISARDAEATILGTGVDGVVYS